MGTQGSWIVRNTTACERPKPELRRYFVLASAYRRELARTRGSHARVIGNRGDFRAVPSVFLGAIQRGLCGAQQGGALKRKLGRTGRHAEAYGNRQRADRYGY